MASRTLNAYIWDVAGKIGVQLSGFVIGIFIARILSPAEYGKVGAAMIFIALSDVFTNMGLGSALVQKKNPEDIHYSSTFFLNTVAAVFIYFIFFLSAPLVETYLSIEGLSILIRVLSLSLVISALSIVYEIQLIRELKFNLISRSKIFSSITSGLIGLTLAYSGYGVWSLVLQQLFQRTALMANYWYSSNWKPSMRFSISAIKELWTYSANMFLSGIINTFYNQIDSLIITKVFSAVELGLYSRAKSLNNFVVKYAYESIGVVTFPVMASLQDKRSQMVELGLKAEKVIAFISLGMLGWLYITASSVITLLLGPKWEGAIPIYQLLCLSGFAYPLSAATLNMLKAIGDSKTFLRVEIVKKIVGVVGLIIGFLFGLQGFLISLIITGAIGVWLNMYFTGKVLEIKVRIQILPLLPYFLFAIAGVALSTILLNTITIHNLYIQLLFLTIIYTGFYVAANAIASTSGFLFLLQKLKKQS